MHNTRTLQCTDGTQVSLTPMHQESYTHGQQALTSLTNDAAEPNLFTEDGPYRLTRGVTCTTRGSQVTCHLDTSQYTLAKPFVVRRGKQLSESAGPLALRVHGLAVVGQGEAEKSVARERNFGHLAMHFWKGQCPAISPRLPRQARVDDSFTLRLDQLAQRYEGTTQPQQVVRNMETAELQNRDVVVMPLPGPYATNYKSHVGYHQGEFGHGWTHMLYSDHTATLPASITAQDRICATIMESDANFLCKMYPNGERRAACEPQDTLMLQVSFQVSDMLEAGGQGVVFAHNLQDTSTVIVDPPVGHKSVFRIRMSMGMD